MTFASLLLALLTATSTPPSDASAGPALLDFHAEWCGPCHKARPAVAQLISQGYPIKTIDIDQEPKLRARYHVEQVPTFIVVDGAGRELDRTTGPQPAAELADFYKVAIAKTQPPASSNAHVGSREESRGGADDGEDHPDHRENRLVTTTTIAPKARAKTPSLHLPIPNLGNLWSGSGFSATIQPALARARSSIARLRSRSFSPVRISSKLRDAEAGAAVSVSAQDHDRPVRRHPSGTQKEHGALRRGGRRASCRLRFHPRRRADPDPARPASAGL